MLGTWQFNAPLPLLLGILGPRKQTERQEKEPKGKKKRKKEGENDLTKNVVKKIKSCWKSTVEVQNRGKVLGTKNDRRGWERKYSTL